MRRLPCGAAQSANWRSSLSPVPAIGGMGRTHDTRRGGFYMPASEKRWTGETDGSYNLCEMSVTCYIKEARAMPLKTETLDLIKKTAREMGARKVFLFGSCLHKDESEAGDIDLGIEGLSRYEVQSLRRRLYSAPEIQGDIDVVRMEDREWIVPLIELDGMNIYES
jgi:predicted nucleotidyltransferase